MEPDGALGIEARGYTVAVGAVLHLNRESDFSLAHAADLSLPEQVTVAQQFDALRARQFEQFKVLIDDLAGVVPVVDRIPARWELLVVAHFILEVICAPPRLPVELEPLAHGGQARGR